MGERTSHDTIATATWTENPGTTRREVIFRRSVLVAMAVLVGAAALGLLGPREATTRADGASGSLSVAHPQITRPGLDAQVTVTLVPDPGSGTALLTLPQEALALLGVQTVHPAPSGQVARDEAVTYEFELSGDDRLTVTFSGRVPVKQGPTRARWWVEWAGEPETARAEMTTWVLP